ncbi:MAG: 4Fe-4S ferredoxin [Sedimentisphaerales bacterium]
MKQKVKELLTKGGISGFLGIKLVNGCSCPHLFTKDDIDSLDSLVVTDERYPLAGIILRLINKYPAQSFGLMVRGCDERALVELHKYHQINIQQIVPLGVACTSELADKCDCEKPYPSQWVVGDKIERTENRKRIEDLEKMPEKERLRYWLSKFSRCMKCYGCRNICPLCFCERCSLEDKNLIALGEIPPEFPVFQLIRAICLAGKCVDCGMCEDTCPSNIPLRSLYKKVYEEVRKLFDYIPGMNTEEKNPLSYPGEGAGLKNVLVSADFYEL